MTFPLFFSFAGAVVALALPICGAIGVYVHLAVRSELKDFLLQLNGTYLRTALYDQKLADTDRRTLDTEARIRALEAAVGAGAGV